MLMSSSLPAMTTDSPLNEGLGPAEISMSSSYEDDVELARHHLRLWLTHSGISDRSVVRAESAQDSEWLRIFYHQMHDFLQKDLDRGWAIFQLFLPISLAPFLAVVALEDVRVVQIFVLGVASVLLLAFASLLEIALSRSRRRRWIWLEAIEAEVGLKAFHAHPPLRDNFRPWKPTTFRLTVVRHLMLPSVAFVWIILGLLATVDVL